VLIAVLQYLSALFDHEGDVIMSHDPTQLTALLGSVSTLLANSPSQQENLLPTLHAIQDTIGCIPAGAVAAIAARFNLSQAEVHGVITFYAHFRTMPPARHTVQVCRAEACQSVGAEQLLAHVERALGCCLHQHSADGQFSLEPVSCLGQCANGPAIMIDDAVHARVTPERWDRLMATAKEAA
jgi:formate dehydrogenase subunit gamma